MDFLESFEAFAFRSINSSKYTKHSYRINLRFLSSSLYAIITVRALHFIFATIDAAWRLSKSSSGRVKNGEKRQLFSVFVQSRDKRKVSSGKKYVQCTMYVKPCLSFDQMFT